MGKKSVHLKVQTGSTPMRKGGSTTVIEDIYIQSKVTVKNTNFAFY